MANERPHQHKSRAEAFAPLPDGYQPKERRDCAYYQAVQRHLATTIAENEAQGRRFPAWVVRELSKLLTCGILAFGFARLRCTDCKAELLVGFSCKGRGVCTSCCVRRSVDTAHHLATRVFPRVRARQWVMTFPYEVRLILARDEELLSEVIRVFHRTLQWHYRKRGRTLGLPSGGHIGAVTFVQRFGQALNLNPHLHLVMADGVFDEDGGFHDNTFLSHGDVEAVLHRALRKMRPVFQRALDNSDQFSAEDSAFLDDTLTRATQLRVPFSPPPERALVARQDGASLHAGVTIHRNDRAGLENLLGYCGRGPIAPSRLSILEDGRISYRLRYQFGGRSHASFDGPTFIRRLAALIPPPRRNQTRYFGVFAPNSSLRAKVMLKPASALSLPEPIAALVLLGKTAKEKKPSTGTRRGMRWAERLWRVYSINVTACACGGQRKMVALVDDAYAACKILKHIGLPADSPEPDSSFSPELQAA